MKQTIEIEVPEGKKAIWKEGTIVFKDIKPQLPKTWEEFCKTKNLNESEAYINSSSECVEIVGSGDRTRRYYKDKNVLPSEKAAKQHLVLMQLHQLRDCYRQGWVPDYTDTSNKFYIVNYFYLHLYKYIHVITDHSTIPRFLSFQSKEIAEEFLNNFRDLIEQAGDLI